MLARAEYRPGRCALSIQWLDHLLLYLRCSGGVFGADSDLPLLVLEALLGELRIHGVDVLNRTDHELSRARSTLAKGRIHSHVAGVVALRFLLVLTADPNTIAIVTDRVACDASTPGSQLVLSLQLLLCVPHALSVLLHVARRPVDSRVLTTLGRLARSAAVAGLKSFRLLRVEVKFAIEIGHCDTIGIPAGTKFPGTTRLPRLVMALAEASLVDRKVRLLVHLAHLRLRRDHLVLRVCGSHGINHGGCLALTVQVDLDRAIGRQLLFNNVGGAGLRISTHEHRGHGLALLSSPEVLLLLDSLFTCQYCLVLLPIRQHNALALTWFDADMGDGSRVVGKGRLVPTFFIV